MPWKRRNNKEYFYRSRRVGGRVEQEYFGAGPGAELIAACVRGDARSRAEARAEAREAARDERAWQGRMERWLDGVLGLAAGGMERAGYHRPDRHRWRRRRGGVPMVATRAIEARAPARRCDGGPPAAPPPLGGKLDGLALDAMCERYCGPDDGAAASRRNLAADVVALAEQLAGPDPPPLVALVAGAAALAYAEARLAQTIEHQCAGTGSIVQAELRDRRSDRAMRRFLRAARELAALRRVDPKVLIQVNQHFGGPPDGDDAPR